MLDSERCGSTCNSVQDLEGQALIEAISMFSDDAPTQILPFLRQFKGIWLSLASYDNSVTHFCCWTGDWGRVADLLPTSRLCRPESSVQALQGTQLTYAAAGVDIDAGDSLVENIKPFCRSTRREA
jgi:hypothetical protein